MKYTITPDNNLAPLCADCATLAASHGLDAATQFELEGATLRTLVRGLIKQDCHIGDDAADALRVEIAQLIAAAEASKAAFIASQPPPRWRVSKDTIIGRIPDADLANVMAALASQSAAEQFKFTQSAWFWSDNATLRGLCAAIGLDADTILAADPFI